MSHLRPDLLPGLLRIAARNRARLCRSGAVRDRPGVFRRRAGRPAAGRDRGQAGATAPRDPGSRRPVDLQDARADAEAVLAAIGAPAAPMIQRIAPGWFHPGVRQPSRSVQLTLAVWGELNPRVLAALDVKGPAVAFTLELTACRSRRAGPPRARRSPCPISSGRAGFRLRARCRRRGRDGAEGGAGGRQGAGRRGVGLRSVRRAEGRGADGEGKKSLAITVRLQPTAATLTEAEIEGGVAEGGRGRRATGGSPRGA